CQKQTSTPHRDRPPPAPYTLAGPPPTLPTRNGVRSSLAIYRPLVKHLYGQEPKDGTDTKCSLIRNCSRRVAYSTVAWLLSRKSEKRLRKRREKRRRLSDED